MSVYEYLPAEIARLGVTRKAAGLVLGQVQTHARLSREREERARQGPAEILNLSELMIAMWECAEWERIAHVMTEQQMPVYAAGQDPRVGRRESSGCSVWLLTWPLQSNTAGHRPRCCVIGSTGSSPSGPTLRAEANHGSPST